MKKTNSTIITVAVLFLFQIKHETKGANNGISVFTNGNSAFIQHKYHQANLIFDTIKFNSFPKEKEISFTEYLKADGAYIRQLFLTDSSLVLLDLQAGSNYFFQQFALNDKKLIRSFIKKGTKFGEAIGGFTGGVFNNETFWFHDLSLSRVITATIPNSLITDSAKLAQFTLLNFYHSIQLKDNTTLFAEGATHAENKIQVLNINTNQEQNLFGNFENKPDNTPYYTWKAAHEGFIYLKPSKDKLVLAHRFTDKIEILDLKTKQSKIISGPFHFEPKFTPRNREGRDEAIMDGNAPNAFINGYLTNKYIYLLYSGKNRRSPNANEADFIYVYDWAGHPVEKINCKKKIAAFAVSGNDDIIYAFEPDSQFVLKATLR